jgi:hypothetical protein
MEDWKEGGLAASLFVFLVVLVWKKRKTARHGRRALRDAG